MTPAEQRQRLRYLESLTVTHPKRLSSAMIEERTQLFNDLKRQKQELISAPRSFSFVVPEGVTFSISDRPAHGYEVHVSIGPAPGASLSALGYDIQEMLTRLGAEVKVLKAQRDQEVLDRRRADEERIRIYRERAARPIATSGEDLLAELGL